MLRITLLILTSLLLASCNSLPAWMGTGDDKKLEGERISLLSSTESLRADNELAATAVTLPPVEQNNDSIVTKAGHRALADRITVQQSDSSGSAAEKLYALPVPLVAEGKLFVIDGKGNLFAHDAADIHKLLWKANILPSKSKSYAIGGGIAYASGVLVATSGFNEIVALHAADGKELWRKSLSNVVRAAPLANDGKITLVTIDNHIYVINIADGTILWQREGVAESVGIIGNATPASERGLLVVPQSSGELLAFNSITGQEAWNANLAYNKASMGSFPLNGINVSPVIQGNAVYAVSSSGGLFALDAASGIPLWKKEIPEIQSLWAAGDYVFVVSNHNEVAAIYAADGRIKWVATLPEFINDKKTERVIASSPVLAGGRLYIALSTGTLAILSPQDGKTLEMLKVNDNVSATPEVALGKLFLFSNDAKIQALY
jgi:outer membrane protein assembly factor BamB